MKPFFGTYLAAAILAAAAVLSVAAAAFYVSMNRPPSFTAAAAMRGNIVASLDEPIAIAAENNADLSFQAGGEIAHLYVKDGQAVEAGAILADLGTEAPEAAVEQAQAAQAMARAKLDALEAGSRPEQIAIDETSVASARSALDAANATLAAEMGGAYTAADDAIRNQSDNLFSNPSTADVALVVPAGDSQLETDVENQRFAFSAMLSAWRAAVNVSSSDAAAPLVTLTNANLAKTKSYLDTLSEITNDALPNSNLSVATLAAYKLDIVTARTEVDAAIAAMVTDQNAVAKAGDDLAAAESKLALTKAGATEQDIEAQQAAVAQAGAALAAAKVALANSTLSAPFSGTVQNVTGQIGQVVVPGAPVLSLVNNGNLKIEGYVSQTDVVKIKNGEGANVTIDAFGADRIFPAKVTNVDDAQTVSNGVPSYKVTLHFSAPDAAVKAGLTGNAHIIIATRDNALEVPARLVLNDGTSSYVLVSQNGAAVKRAVTTGITGDDGMVEIVSGISDGDRLINF